MLALVSEGPVTRDHLCTVSPHGQESVVNFTGMLCDMFGVALKLFRTLRCSKLREVCSVAPKAELPSKAAQL